MTVGLVYFADDPDKKVFRRVFPSYAQGETDAVLDDPQWTTIGLDPARVVVLEKVADDDPRVDFTSPARPAKAP